MEVRSMRLDHGPIQTNNMSYPQRQPQNHRPNHSNQATAHVSAAELYKPSRSPLSNTRCPYPPSSQLQPTPTNITQVQVSQRYPPQGPAASVATPAPSSLLTSAPTYHRPQPDYRHTNRISLLHPEYGPGGRREASGGGGGGTGGQLQPAPGEQPLKKIRLTDKELQPLRIDTRPGTYFPQVEAISPIFPEQISQEDQAFKTTKDELIQQISKVDREILKAEQQIVILKKKQAELEEIANKPSVKNEVEEDAQPKHQSLPQKIYAENRKKAQSAHAQLDSLGPKVEWPLYNQPTDTTVFHENNRRNVMFKKRLLEYFKKKHAEKHAKNNLLSGTYSKLMQEWVRKVDKIESSTKRKMKEAKNREFFEKIFPEVRRQRENKERSPIAFRFNRVGSRVKSEADMEEIMDNLQEQALEDKKMRSYAVIPPILLDPKERRIKYTNNNNFIEDMEAVYKSRQYLNIWTAGEKETFKDKYLQHPKNFYQISQALGERKSVSECVHYYYLSKKTENYKRLLRKNKRDKLREKIRQSRNSGKVNNSANLSVVDTLTTGVTTRLQREQQQRTEGTTRTSETPAAAAAAVSAESTSGTANNSSPPPPAVGTTATPSPLNVGATTTMGATSTASTSSTTAASTADWTGTTNTSTSQAPSGTTPPTTTTASVILSSSSPSPIASTSATTCLTTTSTTTTVTVAGTPTPVSTPLETANVDDDAANENPIVKFSDFNSFEDYNNRQKFFGDGSASAEKEGDQPGGEQNDKENIQEKKDGEVTLATNEAACDRSMSASTPVPENKKKKERRKENPTIESSDEEAASVQDKALQGNCAVCNAQLGPQLHSRPLQPSHAAQYGLREDQVPPNSRVCNTCRCKCVRSRYTHCPLPSCPNSRGRVKRLRSFPYRLQELPAEVRDPILAEFRIPSGVTKCCSACFNRIQRRLGPVEEWPEDEINQLKSALTELGANWQLIGERLNKRSHQVRSFYAANRKRLNLESCLGDRKPTLTDEEESGSSTSSCEEPMRERERHSSDTTSAAESPPVLQGANQNAVKKEDYDSSATETADEAQTDHYQAATITPVVNDYQQRPAPSPLSVKELVMNVIEISLNKNAGGQQPGAVQGPALTPTISSILNNDANEVTIVSEYNLNSMPNRSQPPHQSRPDISLTKLANTIGATITPVSGPIRAQPQPEIPRDDLVVVQVPDTREAIPETLDLSIKKPREPLPPAHAKHLQPPMHRQDPAYMYHQERKSPAFIRTSQVKLPSPQPANPKTGSITLGTPIINQPTRYDGLLRQMPDKMGSITKGTPMHTSHSLQQDKRVYEYYAKQGRIPAQQPQYQYPPQRNPYDQQISSQMSSRQIIIDDYITSQQMHNRRQEKPQYYPANSPHRTPPPPQPQSQQRQGVIQRHTRPQYHAPPPGHEALSTLVELSVQQPSLPVPSAPHEGLGKTMADNLLEQPHRLQLLQHQQQMRQQQQRMEEQRRVAYHQQQQQQQQQQQVRQQGRTDPSTMTAASLIDAIITHQINQTAETGRGDVVANTREPPRAGDLLFQGFQREPSVSQDNNGLRPPSIISVDLDNDGVNKNLTVKELTDSVINHDFSTRPGAAYYHLQESEQWKRRLQAQQQQKEDSKRSATPSQQQQQDERQIIRIAQPQKYHHEPVSPPETNHWSEQNYRRYQQPQSHMSPLDYVKNRIVEVMRTEDDNKKDMSDAHGQDKDRSDSPGDMVIDEEKHENDFGGQQQSEGQQQRAAAPPPPQGGYSYSYVHKDTANDNGRNNEPKPLLSAQYEPLSDED